MNKLLNFLKKEPVLSIAAFLAIGSCFFVVPDKEYISYCNFEVLGILLSLMLVVAGFTHCGLFDFLTSKISQKIKKEKTLVFFLSILCFFSSSLITNDVALITFVPFTIALMKNQGSKSIIFAVTLETVSANLGSLLTPIGNPQNLFLYSYYDMTISEFFAVTLPLGAICLVLVCTLVMIRKNRPLDNMTKSESVCLKKLPLSAYTLLFVLSILSVLGIVEWFISLLAVCIFVFLHNKKLILKADYILLLTFICFFVFVGNVARIDAVSNTVSKLIYKKELLFSALISQVISNVPAAAMLSSFTENGKALIQGTNIGGLGTIIASMASLISYRFISKTEGIKAYRYLGFFSVVNFSLLALLIAIYLIL